MKLPANTHTFVVIERFEYAQNSSPLYSALFQFIEFTKNGNVFSILFRDFIPFNFTILCAFYCPFQLMPCIHAYIQICMWIFFLSVLLTGSHWRMISHRKRTVNENRKKVVNRCLCRLPQKKIRTNYVFHACAVNIFISI